MATGKSDNSGGFSYDPLDADVRALKHSLANRLEYSAGKDASTATPHDWLNTASYVVRDRLMERWIETMRSYHTHDVKRVYYLSLEFLMGRTLTNGMLNLGMSDECEKSLHEVGVDMEEIRDLEPDAGLGNGGLGRLAACYLDSLATLQMPGYGYGIRYEYGMFNQRIENGWQVEHPDNWLRYGNPWEFPRAELLYPVKFAGRAVEFCDEKGCMRHHWVDAEEVMAMAVDTPIPGYQNGTVNNMRLWSAKASRDFDLKYFNEGNYIKAVAEKNESENLSKVLYPDDTTSMGQALRLKQQYFFVSASLQDILYRHSKNHDDYSDLADKVAIQLNDTHPAIAIAELMRILVDVHAMPWKQAWEISRKVFSYTNHTLLPEALETWPVPLFEAVLPRHLKIIYEINHRFLKDVLHCFPDDIARMQRMSIIDDQGEKRIRMAHLAIVGSHKVNGVSAIHTELMRQTIFSDFDELYPNKIINITNGITPRRWLNQANPMLAKLISSKIKGSWLTELSRLEELLLFADDIEFHKKFMKVKHDNKEKLAELIDMHLGIKVDPSSMFDVQVKRMHEYKRQLLNVLHVITRYNMIRRGETDELVPRTVIFSGKAAPGYAMAKLIIKLINDVADMVNNDPAVMGMLRVVFIPNYDVSTAEDIIPAADLSEQISLAGMEASGTGNMKLALNGAMTIGTQDGANIEIAEAVGKENIFSFGMNTDEVSAQWAQGYSPRDFYNNDPRLKEAIDMIGSGYFSHEDRDRYESLVSNLLEHDQYMLCADYASYIDAQLRADKLYDNPHAWATSAIKNVGMMGHLSSDRAIKEYAEKVWGVVPIKQE
ncbi:MAG: glycogen/starch/alpha-glucan phosphorylase [Sulfuriflexus sp.]|nr:glycogen/starch/alpha-glucan phosphorylase [Sulfuriflexus sp.]